VDEDGRNIQVSKWNYIDQGLHFLQLLIVAIPGEYIILYFGSLLFGDRLW